MSELWDTCLVTSYYYWQRVEVFEDRLIYDDENELPEEKKIALLRQSVGSAVAEYFESLAEWEKRIYIISYPSWKQCVQTFKKRLAEESSKTRQSVNDEILKCESQNGSNSVSCTEGVVIEQSKKVDEHVEQASECEVDIGVTEGCSQISSSFEVGDGGLKTEDGVKRGECSHIVTVVSSDEDMGNVTVTEEWIGERAQSLKRGEKSVDDRLEGNDLPCVSGGERLHEVKREEEGWEGGVSDMAERENEIGRTGLMHEAMEVDQTGLHLMNGLPWECWASADRDVHGTFLSIRPDMTSVSLAGKLQSVGRDGLDASFSQWMTERHDSSIFVTWSMTVRREARLIRREATVCLPAVGGFRFSRHRRAVCPGAKRLYYCPPQAGFNSAKAE